MPQVINTNIASLNAQRNLNKSQSALSTSLQRLSSGQRINSAKDDAAGLAISERFTAQIRGLNQAVRNSNDGISLAQTAEGALGEVTNNLQRIRELAVQSANVTNSVSDRAAMQQEVSQLISEIDRVAGQTNFNGVKLLDGSFNSQNFQVGANVGETISIASIVDATRAGLGLDNGVATATSNTVVGATALVAGDLTINGRDVGAVANDAAALATAIAASGSNVSASATNTRTIAFNDIVGTALTATTSGAGAGFNDIAVDGPVATTSATGADFAGIVVDNAVATTSAIGTDFADIAGASIDSDLTVDGIVIGSVALGDAITEAQLDAQIDDAFDVAGAATIAGYTRTGSLTNGNLVISRADGGDMTIATSGDFGLALDGLTGTTTNGTLADAPVGYRLQIDSQDVINTTLNPGQDLTEGELDIELNNFITANSSTYSKTGSLAAGNLVISKIDGSDMTITQTGSGLTGLTGTSTNGTPADPTVNYVLNVDGTDVINQAINAGQSLTASDVDTALDSFISGSSGAYTKTGTFAGGDLVLSKTSGLDMTITETGANAVSGGFEAMHTNGDAAVPPDYTLSIDGTGVNLGSAIAGNDAVITGDELATAISGIGGFTASFSAGNLTITKANGSNFTITEAGGDAAGAEGFAALSTTHRGTLSVTSNGEDLVIGGNAAAKAGLTPGTTAAIAGDLSVETVAGANALITAVDSALNTVNGSRATLGAIQNRFESVVTNLQTSSESLSAARSRVLDADFAAETANLTKTQILQQAGTAMLAQANQLPQGVLSLLQ